MVGCYRDYDGRWVMQCLYTTGTHHGIDDTVVGYEDARRLVWVGGRKKYP